jgi:hypothetical protein
MARRATKGDEKPGDGEEIAKVDEPVGAFEAPERQGAVFSTERYLPRDWVSKPARGWLGWWVSDRQPLSRVTLFNCQP